MKQYSSDLRERALRQVDAGRPVGEVAVLFGVHRTTLLRWRWQRDQGDLGPRPRPGRTPKIGRAQHPALLVQVQAAPDATLAEHCATWTTATGVPVSAATMCRVLQRLRWPLKKSR
jgi:transposase